MNKFKADMHDIKWKIIQDEKICCNVQKVYNQILILNV